MGSRAHYLLSILRFRINCRFACSCTLYSNTDHTCTHAGGEYCGKYRTFNNKARQNSNFNSIRW